MALLLNWYRYAIATKYGIANFKPVILFRSKSIEESKADYQKFLELCKNVKTEDFDFVFDPNTFEIIGPKGDPYNPERKVNIVENDNHQTWEDKETEIEYEMPTIEF